ncbi:MAG: hypothetical protein A2939_01225 [Parcubacteria group bacterium RIFCSPLOWO2_01_FULL_48_18]|nr:MAG: hypothetical protein A2939_01225 [Parcubacteria group bacterium RIFCSPLOWO2_01_FULL_48_18]
MDRQKTYPWQNCRFDLIAMPGGAKNLVQPEKPWDKDHALFNIEFSVIAGQPTVITCIDFRFWEKFLEEFQFSPTVNDITLTTHSDCGAYGGLKEFSGDADQEYNFLFSQMNEAEKVVSDWLRKFKEIEPSIVKKLTTTFRFAKADFNSYPAAHTCKALVFSCSETGAWQAACTAVKRAGVQSFDVLTTYGGARRIVTEDQSCFRDHTLRSMEISRTLHHIEEIILVGHAKGRCDMERSDVFKAARIVEERFPEIRVEVLVI